MTKILKLIGVFVAVLVVVLVSLNANAIVDWIKSLDGDGSGPSEESGPVVSNPLVRILQE